MCHNHPEQMDTHSEKIGKAILQVIEECVEGKAKVSFPLLEGCFKGMADYLYNFEQPYELIYEGVKMFVDSKEQKRRGHARGSYVEVCFDFYFLLIVYVFSRFNYYYKSW